MPYPKIFNVAFFSDRAMLPGLHASLASLLVNSNTLALKIYVFSDGLQDEDLALLSQTFELNSRHAGSSLHFEKAPNMAIKGANALHGNYTTYGRLYLAQILKDDDYVLYLDSDLIIELDVAEIFASFDDQHILFVDGTGTREYTVDRQLFLNAGLDLASPCFNAGVIGINLKRWRAEHIFEKCMDVIAQYPYQFKSADQAVLNVALHNDFKSLGEKINSMAFPSVVLNKERSHSIYHFVGSPKPWDIFARRFHQSYQLWEKYHLKGALANRSLWPYYSLKRTINISKSYLKLFQNVFKNQS